MLRTRILSAVTIVAALVVVMYVDQGLAPWFPLWFFVSALVMAAAARELVDLLSSGHVRPDPRVVGGGLLAILTAHWLPHLVAACPTHERFSAIMSEPSWSIGVFAWPFFSFTAVVMAAFVVESLRFERPGGAVDSIAATILVVAYVGMLGGFMVQMRWLEGCKHGLIPLAMLIATAKGADVGAYAIGRLFGRRKLWPSLSPNKTVAGGVGGLMFATLATLIVEWVAQDRGLVALGWIGATAFGLTVGLTAQVGDLMESLMKRDRGRKDASATIPGFGGVLDVVDSLLFAAPVAYGFWAVLGP